MSTEALCPDCGHPIRFSDSEAGRCEKIVGPSDAASLCGHVCRHPDETAPHDPNEPPKRYCTRCKEPIDPKRVMRASSFCSNECRHEDQRERRAFRASKACRLCGRKARPKPTTKPPEAMCDGSTASPAPPTEVM